MAVTWVPVSLIAFIEKSNVPTSLCSITPIKFKLEPTISSNSFPLVVAISVNPVASPVSLVNVPIVIVGDVSTGINPLPKESSQVIIVSDGTG